MLDHVTWDAVRAALTADLAIFMLAAFMGALVTGVAGFAFGLVASSIWLHVITPVQSAVLIAAFACVSQSMAVWRLRREVKIERIWPFVVGGIAGVPLGAEALRWTSPNTMRGILGGFIILFCAWTFFKPELKVQPHRPKVDVGVGVLGGIVGAMTGLAGVIVNIWTTAQGLPKNEQRAVFQPTAVIMFMVTLAWLSAAGIVPPGTWTLFFIGLPLIFVGTWIGFQLYGKLDDAAFRRLVLWLLLISGLVLVPSAFRP